MRPRLGCPWSVRGRSWIQGSDFSGFVWDESRWAGSATAATAVPLFVTSLFSRFSSLVMPTLRRASADSRVTAVRCARCVRLHTECWLLRRDIFVRLIWSVVIYWPCFELPCLANQRHSKACSISLLSMTNLAGKAELTSAQPKRQALWGVDRCGFEREMINIVNIINLFINIIHEIL